MSPNSFGEALNPSFTKCKDDPTKTYIKNSNSAISALLKFH